MIRRGCLVTGLALIATTLTVSALAQEAPAQPAPKPQVATAKPQAPAVTRPGKKLNAAEVAEAEADEAEALVEAEAPPAVAAVPVALPPAMPEPVAKTELPIRTADEALDLKPETESSNWTMKLILVAGAVAIAAFLLYRRKTGGWQSKIYELKVLSRASVGVRSELIVVDVDGRAMLLGITPSSIHRLATLGGDEAGERRTSTQANRDLGAQTPSRAAAARDLTDGLTVGREFADRSLGLKSDSTHLGRTQDVESAFEDMLNSAKAEQNERIRGQQPRRSAPASARADRELDLDDDLDVGQTDRAPRRSTVRPRNRYDAPSGRNAEAASGMEQQVRGLMRVGRRA